MSKQIYIDSNGNEIQVSGTVNTADMMPMSGNDSTKVATAIGDLSQLTTSDKSSLVGAVKEVDGKIKVIQDTKTTTAQGYIDLGLDARNYQILQVTPVEDAANTIAFVSRTATVNYAFFYTASSMVRKVSTTITYDVVYLEL